MSHSVTVTRTTTTSSSSAMMVNIGYITKPPGILKVVETILGVICLGIIGYYSTTVTVRSESYTFFYLSVFGFLLGTFLLLLSSVCSFSTASMLAKTLFEVMFHVVGFIFLFCGGIAIMVPLVQNRNNRFRFKSSSEANDGLLAASVLGIINSIMYLISAILSYRSFRQSI